MRHHISLQVVLWCELSSQHKFHKLQSQQNSKKLLSRNEKCVQESEIERGGNLAPARKTGQTRSVSIKVQVIFIASSY